MFLLKVYQQWRAFFWVILFAFTAQFFFMVKGIENIPFFLYHMYSYPHVSKDSFNVILIKTQGRYLDPYKLSGRESEMLMNNVSHYNQMKKKSWNEPITQTVTERFKNRVPGNTYNYLQKSLVNDSASFSRYINWWEKYFSRIYSGSNDSVVIVSGFVHYRPVFSKSSQDSILFTCFIK